MSWFEDLTGISEHGAAHVHENFTQDGTCLVSKANGRRIECGRLEVARVDGLEAQAAKVVPSGRARLQLSQIVGDVGALHRAPENAGALFQAASQFNLLEMAAPDTTPEQGIGIYEHDRTQGPVCAIACGGGTIYRNYFADIGGQIGQSADRQIDCLACIGGALEPFGGPFWEMQNGYAFGAVGQLRALGAILLGMGAREMARLGGALRIGMQWDAEVTTASDQGRAGHLVSQAYCSALPLGYSSVPKAVWEPFARLVLEAAYRATFAAGVINATRTGNNRVYLTLVGGGVFANPLVWITDAIGKAARAYADHDLDCQIVSYGQSDPALDAFMSEWNKT